MLNHTTLIIWLKFATLNFNSTTSLTAFQHQSKHSRTWSNNSLGGPKANTQFFISKGTRFDHEIQYWHHNAILLSIVCSRISEVMSCEDSTIFFANIAYIPHIRQKNSRLFTKCFYNIFRSKITSRSLGDICKCKQYFWTLHNSFFHKL